MSKEFREWLKKVEMLTGERNDLTGNGMRMAYANAIQKYDELFEKVIIPQFIADWIEVKKESNRTLLTAIWTLSNIDKIYEWVNEDVVENGNKLIKAWIYGYEVEQEKKYLVKVPHTTRDHYYKYPNGGVGTVMGKSAGRDEFVFTEEEINKLLPDVPEKYWEEIK